MPPLCLLYPQSAGLYVSLGVLWDVVPGRRPGSFLGPAPVPQAGRAVQDVVRLGKEAVFLSFAHTGLGRPGATAIF